LPPNVKVLTLYSDSCGGQNRNIKVSLFLLYALQKHPTLEIINQKFFIPGHSFDSCDRDFGIIEKSKSKHEEIFMPQKWFEIIAEAKKKKPQFSVHLMKGDMFFSSKTLNETITNRKISADGEKVSWLNIRWIQYRKAEPKKLYYKTNISNLLEFQQIDIAKKEAKGRPNRELPEPELLYPNGKGISKEKKKDLLSLLKYVPPVYHNFYKQLKVENDLQNTEEEED